MSFPFLPPASGGFCPAPSLPAMQSAASWGRSFPGLGGPALLVGRWFGQGSFNKCS